MGGKISCKDANQMDLVEFLEKLGHLPQKIRGNDYWYVSPLREEKTPSFKVNRVKNLWYDHGTGNGGTLVDFGKAYFRCNVKTLLERLSAGTSLSVPFHPHPSFSAGEKKGQSGDQKIRIISDAEITSPSLKRYLTTRQIPLIIAKEYCREICFELNSKIQHAIGFPNAGGGYELRNRYFKGSSTPKEPTLIPVINASELVVFEGLFSFLSYQTIRYRNTSILPKQHASILVLNTLAFFEKSRAVMEKHTIIHLCLDRDKRGQECTQMALKWSDKYRDQSILYQNHKDLNEYLVNSVDHEIKQQHRRGMRL